MASDPPTARNAFFQELKPRCIAINKLAVQAPDKKAVARDLIAATEDLSSVLQSQIARDPSVLDHKLADYIFFPLSNILRNQQEYPIRLTEITIKCLRILIQHGWRANISKELSQQLLILLTFMTGGVPGKEKQPLLPEETRLEAFRTLTALVKATGSSASGAASLVETSAVPALGHTITVALDTATGGETPTIQLEALQSLEAIFTAVKDHEALATFLPGTVSSLSKLLTPPAAWKTSKRVLIRGIEILRLILVSVLGDIRMMGVAKRQSTPSGGESTDGKVLTESWLKASADQVKLALANVLKLRTHESDDVRDALGKLCIGLLDECHKSLSTCTSILVESAMIISSDDSNKSLITSHLNTSLEDLAGIFPELTETVKMTVYNWVTSLPRLMQSGDEEVKKQALRNLQKGQRFLSTLRIDSSTLGDSLSASLRDSLTAIIAMDKATNTMTEVTPSDLQLGQIGTKTESSAFQPVIMSHNSQRATRSEFQDLITKNGSLLNQAKLAGDMLEYVRASTGISQVASYWLAFEMVKSGLTSASDLDEFLDFSSIGDSTYDYEHALQEVYSFSVGVLDTDDEDELDWRLQALALEVTTYSASRMGADFRPELIDVLYPIAKFLGSPVPQLREHAIIALNSIATSCGYPNVSDLIIDNVDYMLNSISLRLDTFDISPASTQVLRMMIKLTGPKLIPFLDDVVASIFAALDNYHGYTSFVESLFSVLGEIVNQGSTSNLLLLEDESRPRISHRKAPVPATTMEEVEEFLNIRLERKRKKQAEQEELEKIKAEGHPKMPWKDQKEPEHEEGEEGADESNREVEKEPPPKTPTYNLLVRIADLTQHYLTSPAPTLRRSLLELLAVVCPALAPDEGAFLPLVNSVWPVLVSRLYDPEPFVVISTCRALCALCESAGDFLSTRIKTEWGDGLGKWCARAKANAQSIRRTGGSSVPNRAGKRQGGAIADLVVPSRLGSGVASHSLDVTAPESGLGRFTQAAQTWEAVEQLLVAVVSFVRVDDAVFEDILALLADRLGAMPEARMALEAVDADAVWLAMYERGAVETPPRPEFRGVSFVEV